MNSTNKGTAIGAAAGSVLGAGAGLLAWKARNRSEIQKYNELKNKRNLSPKDKIIKETLKSKLRKSKIKYGLSGAAIGGAAGTVVGHEAGANRELKKKTEAAINDHRSRLNTALEDKKGEHYDANRSKPIWKYKEGETGKSHDRKSTFIASKRWFGKNKNQVNQVTSTATQYKHMSKDGLKSGAGVRGAVKAKIHDGKGNSKVIYNHQREPERQRSTYYPKKKD